MKIARGIIKTLFFILLGINTAIFGSLIYLNHNLGEEFKIKKGGTLDIESPLPVTAVYNGSELSSGHTKTGNTSLNVDLKVFGVIPCWEAKVDVVDELQVSILGQPFGMKLYTKGVLVVDITEVATKNGNRNPAKSAGIKLGDYILTVNGKEISTNEELMDIVENSKGKELKIVILRNGKRKTVRLRAEINRETGKYKLGIWVRDSSAGIGTLTFYSPALNIICGLGHGVCDEDTGEILNLSSGEIVEAEIFEVQKGSSGTPGQLKGRIGNQTLGEICLNSVGGVYSTLTGELHTTQTTEVALKSEVKSGNAEIICTIDGKTPQSFKCKISFKKGKYNSPTQNLIVTITDNRLLNATGGIVQGLSGSPILQNGKLVGAVTHVLVDDPEKGYGIFAENMLETARSLEGSQEQKDAG